MSVTPACLDNDLVLDCPGYQCLDVIETRAHTLVFRARQLSLNRMVTIRATRAESGCETAASLLRREAATLARFHHPHIVSLLDQFEVEGRVYLVQNHGGTTLAARTAGKTQPAGLAASLVERLARTLAHIHQRGIVHCNLKPRKVFLMAAPAQEPLNLAAAVDCEEVYGIPLLGGFELALDGQQLSRLQPGEFRGTPSYMAPEQARGCHHEVGIGTDIHGLGTILYELLTGRPPFQAATPDGVMRRIIETPSEPVRQLNRGVDHKLEAICLKCLHKEPQRRYSSGLELASALRDYRQGRSKRWGF